MLGNLQARYETKYFMSFIWAAILAADIIAGLYFMAGQSNRVRYVTNDFNVELVKTFEKQKINNDYSIVLLGNSRLRHAVDFGIFVDITITLPNNKTISALQFAPNAARFSLFQKVSSQIIKADPDLIIIQDSVISNAPNKTPNAVSWSKTIYGFLFNQARDIDEFEMWQKDRLAIMAESSCLRDFTNRDVDQQLAFNKNRDAHDISENNNAYREALDFIETALSNHIKVVILSIPPNKKVLSEFNIEQHQTDFFGIGHDPSNMELLPELYTKVTFWDTAPQLDNSYYCDLVHFNHQGRQVFSDWLRTQLVMLL